MMLVTDAGFQEKRERTCCLGSRSEEKRKG